MSAYSEIIGSFKRTGDFPLEANYIFATEADLVAFYEDEQEAATLHEGLLKVVLDDGDGNQALYWVTTDSDGNLIFEKLIDSTLETQITSLSESTSTALSDLQTALEQEIADRTAADTTLQNNIDAEADTRAEEIEAIWGTSDTSEIDESLNSILKLVNALTTIQGDYVTNDELDEAIENLYNTIEGSTTPTTDFQTLRGVEDFVRALQSQVVNAVSNLQSELDQTQNGVGLNQDGSYSPDTNTYFISETTSIANALKVLDATIQETKETAGLIDSVEYDATTETITINFALSSGETTTIQFAISDLIREWEPSNADDSAITLTRTAVIDGIDQLSADIKIDESTIVKDDSGTLSVQVSASSEEFLSTTDDGLTLTGVQDAIDTAAAAATTKVELDSEATHLTLTSTTEDDNSTTYTLGETDIASASDLSSEINRATEAESTLQSNIDTVETKLTPYSSDSTILITIEDSGTDFVVNIDNDTIKQNDDNELYTVNALSDSEKAWIEEQLFDTLFTVSISRSASSVVFSGSSYTVTWTLTCQYDGTNVDLDSTPSGWTWSSTGVYTKTTTVTSSTGSSVSSGSVSCTYTSSTGTSGTKTASSVSCTNIKYSYIYTTTDSELSSLDDIDFDEATQMSSSNSVSGTYSITFTEGQYAYFIIANTSSVSSITQLGLNYVNDYESMTRTNYGTYKVYRSTNAMSASTQDVTVS